MSIVGGVMGLSKFCKGQGLGGLLHDRVGLGIAYDGHTVVDRRNQKDHGLKPV